MTSEKAQIAAELLFAADSAVALTGAGISTPSGIPDFRSPKSGLWEGIDPLTVASIYGFRQDPQAFYDWIYPLTKLTVNAEPNPAHYALAALEDQGKLKGVITQNIDMLHTRAGSHVVYELHGHFREATCVHCFTVFDAEPIIQQFLLDHNVPHCSLCGGVIKPNVILFGEQLPIQTLMVAQDLARKADLMLIVGTSLEVAPASDLPMLAGRNGAKMIIINLEPTHLDNAATVVIHANAAEILPEIVQQMENIHEHDSQQ
ncbi:MAG: NAD-dependent deacylase [Chloroflexota bacterium]